MKTFYCDHFVLPLPGGHRFPMAKYRLLRERVSGHPGVELVVPDAVGDDALRRAHTERYLRAVVEGRLRPDGERRIGFPWSPELIERSRRSVGGTLGGARAALCDGWAANLAGGTHHALADGGEGFCVFNDVAVAALALFAEGRVGRVAVLDLDVHQGNGTAVIFRDDPRVLTVSVHGEKNYPFTKEPGDLDLGLPDGAGDEAFLEAVEVATRRVLEHEPELTFFVSGADAWEGDRLGRLAVTREGMAARDRLLLDRHAAAGVPVVAVMGGGYADRVEDTVEIHAHTVLEMARREVARRRTARAGSTGRRTAPPGRPTDPIPANPVSERELRGADVGPDVSPDRRTAAP